MATKLGMMVAYLEGYPPIKSYDAFTTLSSRVLITTKLGRIAICLDWLLLIK